MMQTVANRHRPLHTAVVTSALLAMLSGAVAAPADDHRQGDDRYYRGDGSGDDYYSDSRYADRYRDDGYGKYKKPKHGKYKKNDDRYYRRGGYDDRYDYDRGYRSYGYYDQRRFVVPERLYYRDYATYDRFYRGSVYYAPHHHSHRVYLFPVIVDGYTEYRPYAYCGDAYFPGQYVYGGPSFGLPFGF